MNEVRAAPRLTLIINSLAGGGAERVFCGVAEALAREYASHCRIEIALLDDEPFRYEPPAGLPLHVLGGNGAMASSVTRLVRFLSANPCDVALSFLSRANCANIIAARALGHAAIISERVATTTHFGAGLKARQQRWITRALYPGAQSVIAVSEGVKRALVRDFKLKPDNIHAIPNPVDGDAIRARGAEKPEAELPPRFIVGMGRLTANKNFALLIEAFARARTDLALAILGEGEERAALEAQAKALGVGARVHFLGFQSNPFAVMGRAEMFVSASNAEGFPNALVEAMALGLPVAFTNCPHGPAEILDQNPDAVVTRMTRARHGLLAPVGDAGALAEAIETLADPENNALYRARALERVAAFKPAEIYARYWSVLEAALAARRARGR